ncbi:hypothetical protein [Kineosporia sp. A_224]|uniref:hypothetical protein n=1 Tax=Kineosporia sp. A_224 TaxID=1962180 RepID=UPI000B4B3D26|nr:hypothetical protein [Kineosporia sp. A_224]
MSGTDDGITGPGADDAQSAWAEWIRPEAAVLGVAGVAAAALARTLTGASGDDPDDDTSPAVGDGDDAGDADAWEQISRDTQQVADHGVTLAAMDGMAQAQADTIESFNPSNY